jgi:hypothetical protein
VGYIKLIKLHPDWLVIILIITTFLFLLKCLVQGLDEHGVLSSHKGFMLQCVFFRVRCFCVVGLKYKVFLLYITV